MSILTGGIHTHTPTLTVIDPRGLAVRVVAYCRSVETAEPEERINRSAYDAMGRLTEQWDPRLWALSAEDIETPANLVNRHSLSGKVLSSISVDAGKRISLFGDGDQLVQTWDSRGSERRVEYDDLLRPLAIFEQGEGEAPRCTERYEYADGSSEFAAHNQCGQLIRHDDPAGTLTVDNYALTGGVLEQTQRFLSALESPDWPPGLPERDALLEPVAQAATSATRFSPLGDVLEQTDAKGNRQLFDYTFDGQLLASHLQLSGQATPQTLVSAIAYSAYGQVEQETAGNGVVSTLTYRPEDGRLMRLQARHGTDAALQDLRYAYDPVGNVLSIEDAALPIRYFANQRVEPIKHFDYDSLYQLIDATGWEAGAASRGPEFNRFDDPGAVANYHQTYRYDAGGNLLELVHVGPQNHSRKLTAARYSNRCLPEQNGRPPSEEEIAAAFDGNGNLLELQPGQAMSWDLRNQLREVRPVERESADDDRELYLYDGDGMRQRKVRSTQTNARSLISEVRYLPGLEIRTREGTGEVLQVICVQAGRSAMQVLHWETTPPSGITNDQYRYNLTDHLGSSSLELDSEAEVISQEAYHPYGGTAWFAGRSEVEAGYKTVRYSGKERDATGFYYYGFRYYAPWLQRWINTDPMGDVDGLNRYRFVRNNPITLHDSLGTSPDGDDEALELSEEVDVVPFYYEEILYEAGSQHFKDRKQVSYGSIHLDERLRRLDMKAFPGEKIEFDVIHTVGPETGLISTDVRSRMGDNAGFFVNFFSPNMWVFKENYREASAGKEFFASDIARRQYTIASKKWGFYGRRPSMIVRERVDNYQTLKATTGLENGSPEMFKAFFEETQNGRSTARILKEFDLRAVSVERKNEGAINFYISVVPNYSAAKLAWRTAVKRIVERGKMVEANA
jgi:insecticidal toxin complex protein TccC